MRKSFKRIIIAAALTPGLLALTACGGSSSSDVKKARGLFQKVIAQSGEVALRDRTAAQDYAKYIMEASGAQNMKDLRAISGDEWIKIESEKNIAKEDYA